MPIQHNATLCEAVGAYNTKCGELRLVLSVLICIPDTVNNKHNVALSYSLAPHIGNTIILAQFCPILQMHWDVTSAAW